MVYLLGAAMLVAGCVCMDLGRRYINGADGLAAPFRSYAGDFVAIFVTALLGIGGVALVRGPMQDFGAASLAETALALASVVAFVKAYRWLLRPSAPAKVAARP